MSTVYCTLYTVHDVNISASTCIPSQTATFLLDHQAVQQYVNNIYIPLLTNKSIRGKRSRTNSANVLMDLKDPTSSWKHVTSPLTVPRDFITFLSSSPASTFRHPWTKKLHSICNYDKNTNCAHIYSSLTWETMFRLLYYDKQHSGSPSKAYLLSVCTYDDRWHPATWRTNGMMVKSSQVVAIPYIPAFSGYANWIHTPC